MSCGAVTSAATPRPRSPRRLGLPAAAHRGSGRVHLLAPGVRPGLGPGERLWVIPPSLDPFSAKNTELSPADVDAALREAALVDTGKDHGSLEFIRRDGSTGRVRGHRRLLLDGGAGDARRAPGAAGQPLGPAQGHGRRADGLRDHLDQLPPDVHLMLVGPDVAGVSDDPEGAEVLRRVPRPVGGAAPRDACQGAPGLSADGRHRRERAPRQRLQRQPRSWSRRALSRGSG